MNKSRLQFVLLVSMFALPVITGWFIIYNPDLLPRARSNNGTLISPIVKTPDFLITSSSKQSETSNSVHSDFWTLILLAKDGCNKECIDRLYSLRQIRKALKNDYKRVKRLLVTDTLPAGFSQILNDNPELTVAIESNLDNFYNILAANNLNDFEILVMDPNRSLMLGFDNTHTSKEILSDMQRLLVVNRWGAGH